MQGLKVLGFRLQGFADCRMSTLDTLSEREGWDLIPDFWKAFSSGSALAKVPLQKRIPHAP